ncbi:hypothetical protein KKB71_00750, partial [Patescibacteria group bacterium]|nr:hypothetical protein [Patescibacteria group bacterium]
MIPFLKQKHFWVVFSILSVVLIVCTTILLTPSSVPTTSVNNVTQQGTDDWKTYVSEKWGFSIEYPSDWKVIESKEIGYGSENFNLKESIGINGTGKIGIRISIWSSLDALPYKGKNLDDWVLEYLDNVICLGSEYDFQKTTVTSQKLYAISYKCRGEPQAYDTERIQFRYNKQTYQISSILAEEQET